MKKIMVLIVVLGMGTMALGALPAAKLMPRAIGPDAVTVDGDLGDWAGADWLILGAGNPEGGVTWGEATDVSNAKYAARWDAGGIYVAAMCTDTVPVWTANDTGWNDSDRCEIYMDATNSNLEGYAEIGTSGAQSDAQHHIVGLSGVASHWATCGMIGGSPPPGPVPTIVTSVAGNTYMYEAYCPSYDGTLAPFGLSLGMTVGLDVGMLSNDGATYSMLQANNVGGKFNDAAGFQDWTLIPEPVTMVLLGLGGVALIRRKR